MALLKNPELIAQFNQSLESYLLYLLLDKYEISPRGAL